MSVMRYMIGMVAFILFVLIRLFETREGDLTITKIGSTTKDRTYLQNSGSIPTPSPERLDDENDGRDATLDESRQDSFNSSEEAALEEEESDEVYNEDTNNIWNKTEEDELLRIPETELEIKPPTLSPHASVPKGHTKPMSTAAPTESVDVNEAYLFKNYSMEDDDKIPNFYLDKFDTYDCHLRHMTLGSHPKFMVIGVHKGGSTALYNYLAKHGRIRPAVCKEIHFFDVDNEFAKGKAFYLRHFPDVSIWKSKVITGEGTPDYIRLPRVPPRVKSVFPDVKLILTLREPGTRFMSHWVGKKQQHKTFLSSMTCEQAWNHSMTVWDACMGTHGLDYCEKELHEDPAVRGIYAPQIEHWLRFFPPKQLLIIQAESMFHDRNATMQKTVKFLEVRPYNSNELDSLYTAYTGSSHHEAPLMKECEPLQPLMDAFYAQFNLRLKSLLSSTFPHVLDDWVTGWSGMND